MEINPPSLESSKQGDASHAAAASSSTAPAEPRGRRLSGHLVRIAAFLHGKASLLWWIHSSWALLFGCGVMWVGAKNFTYVRIIVFHIGFIWLTSLTLPIMAHRSWLAPPWRERVRLLINYFNKNFYQQLLFFLLPIYYASTTLGSRNMLFLFLLAASAMLSTMDVIYDRYVSARWQLTGLFFTFNLFAAINVMLPVLWSISNHAALWISAVLALGGFASMLYRLSGLTVRRVIWLFAAAAMAVLALIEILHSYLEAVPVVGWLGSHWLLWPGAILALGFFVRMLLRSSEVDGRQAAWLLAAAAVGMLVIIQILPPFVPPAPIRLASAEFGSSIRALTIASPLGSIPSDSGRIVVLTAIKAPMGLEEKVRHRWYLDGKEIYTSNYHSVTGGRKDGYRLWTQITWRERQSGRVLTVDVETEGGQLIGRARLRK